MMSILPTTPQCSWVPRPVLPMKPLACESSTKTRALYFSARATIWSSLARSPSMENEPSVMISLTRAAACSCSFSSRCPMSECLKVSCWALHRRMPSTIEACTRRSEIITSCSLRIASKTPALASMHEGKRMVSSVPRNVRQLALQLLVDVLGAADEAHRGHAVAAGVQSFPGRLDHVGVRGKPEIIVGAHVDHVLLLGAGRKLHFYFRVLGGADDAFFLEYAGTADAVQLGLVDIADVVVECHGAPTGC